MSKEIWKEPLSKNVVEEAKQKETNDSSSDEVYSKNTIFVSTLPFDATKEDIEEFFSSVGPIRSCFIIKNKETGHSTGCGYVQFALPEDAEAAIGLKKKIFKEKRTLKIVKAFRKKVVTERKEGYGVSCSWDTNERYGAESEK
jgi:nucleolar protein 4